MSKDDEMVLVFPADVLKQVGIGEGFTLVRTSVRDGIVGQLMDKAKFMRRGDAETNEAWLQFIPYIVVRSKGKVLAYQRTPKGGESRLHGKWSVGVGGHVNQEDVRKGHPGQTLLACVDRESKEEVNGSLYPPTLVGTVYERETAVGRVHFGVVYVREAAGDVAPSDEGLANFVLEEPSKLGDKEFELWSKHVLEGFLTSGENA